MTLAIELAPHPLLDAVAFVTRFARPLADLPADAALTSLLTVDAPAPLRAEEAVRDAVRELLRHGGFKPSGRSKPASEYLVRAVAEGRLGSINRAVDACNVVSYHSGLPISVVDLDLVVGPLRVALADADAEYVFNASGQMMAFGGLVALHDELGPCANAVKDSQRTKTRGETRRTLSVLWGARRLAGRAAEAARWYRELLRGPDAETTEVEWRATPA